jgi:hypothetical protein
VRYNVSPAAPAGELAVRPPEGFGVGWLREPESILTADNGTLELADSGDPEVAADVLRRLAERFGAVVRDRLFRNLMGDPDWEREY